jgi:hypothetical protein
VRASATRPISLVMLGVTLFIAGLVGSWAQDVAAPWINLGEAQMGSTISFDAHAGKYRVISSGATRPALAQTGCTIELPDGTAKRALGGSGGVNARETLGVSRVLQFRARSGATRLTCADRILSDATHGRFQVVAADGPVSKAIIAAFVLGAVSILAGGLWLVLLFRRPEGPAGPSSPKTQPAG